MEKYAVCTRCISETDWCICRCIRHLTVISVIYVTLTSWSFHAISSSTTCANMHQNWFPHFQNITNFGNRWTDRHTNGQRENTRPVWPGGHILVTKRQLAGQQCFPSFSMYIWLPSKPASVALLVASQYALPGYGDRRVWVRGPGWPDHCVKVIAAYAMRSNSQARKRVRRCPP